MSNGTLSSDTPVARLCHIIQWKHFDGYGFNLHAEKGKPGQYIGKVDEGSPAEAAGLKEGDRIVEVNGVNILNENHKQVVQRIKAIPNETKLLVVDAEADKYYKTNNITIKGNLPEVKYLKTPTPETETVKDDVKAEDLEENKTDLPSYDENVKKSSDAGSSDTTPSTDRKSNSSHLSEHGNDISAAKESNSRPGSIGSNSDTIERNNVNSGINLNMSAKELREKLASRKKYDPKKESMDFKKKFEIVQTL